VNWSAQPGQLSPASMFSPAQHSAANSPQPTSLRVGAGGSGRSPEDLISNAPTTLVKKTRKNHQKNHQTNHQKTWLLTKISKFESPKSKKY